VKIRPRKLVVIAAALTLALGVAIAILAMWLLKTPSGMEFVRGRFVRAIKGSVHGRMYVGTIGGSLLSAPRIDSIEIRDADDSVLVATGPITFEYDLLDLWDKRIEFRNVVVQHPYVHLRHDKLGVWNYKKVFGMGDSSGVVPKLPDLGGRKLGGTFLLENVTLKNASLAWTEPWVPARWLQGAARDSAIRFNLKRKDADVRRVGRDLIKTRHWTILQLRATHVRLKEPGVRGQSVVFTDLDADESDPPFIIRNAHGHVVFVPDTVRVGIDGFQLPGSSGSASGTLLTKRGLGVRVRVIGDTVSLADIAWIYPTLPTEGTGRMILDISKDSTNDHIDYAITRMDVTSTRSTLRGAMTFGVGEEILGLTNVDLDLAPVDFKLIEQFNGGPLTLPWAGQLRGHVTARGGPVNHFYVDSTAIEFTDGNVAGIVNRFRGSGELDITRPILTTFHDFAADVQHFDLRTAQALNKLFPPWKGWAYGTAKLDSIWTDVRIRDGDFHYVADSGLASRFTGGGRVTTGEVEMIYDLALTADPMLLDAVALTYPAFPLRGTFRGPFTMKGPMRDLFVTGDVSGEGGRARTANLHMNALGPVFSADGNVELLHIAPERVLRKPPTWKGDLSATIEMAVNGDSLSHLNGGVKLTVAPRSTLGGVRIQGGYSRLTFGQGLMHVDSLALYSDAVNLHAQGGLGLAAGRSDSLRLWASVDSLGGLRPFVAPLSDSLPPDSLSGTITATARFVGSLDSLDMQQLMVRSFDIAYGTTTGRHFNLDADIADLTHPKTRKGTAAFTSDGVVAGGIRFKSVHADATLSGGNKARVTGQMLSETGPVIDAGADVAWDSLAVRTTIDSLHMAIGDHQWRLTRPTSIVSTLDVTTVDSLDLRSGANARLRINARIPVSGDVLGSLRADAFPLDDLGLLSQSTFPLSGAAALSISLTGTRSSPILDFDLVTQNATVGESQVGAMHVSGAYRDRSLVANLEYRHHDAVVLHGDAKVPMDLALRPVAHRMLDLPLTGSLTADSTDLAVLESFTKAIQKASGRLDAHLTIGGTWKAPRVDGKLQVARGAMSIPALGATRYDNIRGQVRFLGDSIQIDSLMARSGGDLKLFGSIGVADLDDPSFNLRLRTEGALGFHAINNRNLADLTITTDQREGIRLVGSKSSSRLTGGLEINGNVYVPESYSKSIIQLDESDYANGMDTSAFGARRLLPSAFSSFIENMRVLGLNVTAGNNLWLRSAEANVQLSGALSMTVAPSDRPGDRGRAQLALEGGLVAEKGTYQLNLGLVRRTFTVVPGGTVSFLGTADNIPTLDISALYTVRQYDQRDVRQDVRVQVNVRGTLAQPLISLSSPDSVRISGADLYSYLITGAPSLEIGGRNSDYGSLLARGFFTSVGSVAGSRLGGLLNLDEVDLSTAGLQGYGGSGRQVAGNVLRGTRFRGGKQILPNVFLRLDAGLCQFGQLFDNTSFDVAGFANTLGFKADWRWAPSLSFSGGLEPPTSALLCAQGATQRGFVPTPRQWAFEFVKVWRF
jgi:hypothetical protein